ncbi:uncharacterized protein LOC142354829, partial [Convolutriloba macropyga]|uniref:uncharacterized protein LOC142354829 n=1 Tax=Convolutriloba macropyga TaxID=536237 RepID=UPI003F521726
LLGQHVEKSKLQRILDRSRTDGDDIDFPDFLKEIDGVIKDPCTESELRRAFRVFDNDNRGKVTFQEMRKAVDKFSTEVTLEIPELEELFVHINMTKDLTFEEMVAKSEKINRFKYGGSVNTAVQARRDARVSSHAAMNSEITVDEFIRTMDIIF